MKNFFKRFAKAITLSFVFILASVTLIACSGSTESTKKVPNVSTINTTDVKTEDTTADEVTDSEEVEEIKINGIFKFDSNYNFNNIYYSNLKELLTFFQTRDLNGVYKEVKNLGFDEFAKNLTKYVSGETELDRAVSIENNTLTNLAYNDALVYSYVNGENNFSFTQKDGKLETAANLPNLEYDAETNKLTIYYQFSYDNNDETVYTPLYVKTTLSFVSYSENLTAGKEFKYSANSSKIVSSSNTTDMSSYLTTLKTMFKIEDAENIAEAITTELASWKFNVDENFEKIVLTYGNNSFSIVENRGDYFSLNGTLDATITSTTIDLTTNSQILTFVVTLDAETTFTFEFVA